jgi:hypothetical protein
MELSVPPDRQMHRDPGLCGTLSQRESTTDWMRYKLCTTIAAARVTECARRSWNPVFSQVKSVRGLRRFLLRGLANVQDEFRLMAFTHNPLKLASPPGRANHEPVTPPLSSPKGHLSHALRRSARGRVGFRRTTTYGMESSRGAAALLSNLSQSRRRTGGAFAEGKGSTDS